MKKSHAISALFVALIGATAVPCHAGFVNDRGAGELRIIGKLSQEEKAAGMGRNVTVREAVRQVVPSDFAVRFGLGADSLVDKRVSWKGGRLWTEVFTDVVASVPDLSAEIDVPAKLVTLSSTQTSRNEQAGPSTAAQSVWRIRNGDKMSETLAAWGREAGWQGVFWEAPDLVSEIDVAFPGGFEEAITKTIEALARHGVQLRVIFYGGNKVVRIVESK